MDNPGLIVLNRVINTIPSSNSLLTPVNAVAMTHNKWNEKINAETNP